MGQEWITNLAQDIKQKDHEAAELYGRQQHQEAIVTAEGQAFFTAVLISLEDNLNEVKRQLQGDATASETTFHTINPTEVQLTRSRFPWFDARLTYRNSSIILDYAKGLGVAGDPTIDRQTLHFAFHVAPDDTLSLEEAFGDNPRPFHHPDQLARHITELLFQP